jgi:SdpC family antimicrobial peptide
MSMKRVPGVRGALFGLATAGALVATSLVGTSASAATSSSPVRLATHTGITAADEQLIDGALFGVGPVAEKLGNSIESLVAPADVDRVTEYAVAAREALVESKPAEVDRAVRQMRSGSVNQVQVGFRALGTAFNEHIEETYTPEEIEAATEEHGSVAAVPMCGAVAACVAAVAFAVYAAAAAHNVVVASAAAAVVVSIALWCGAWVGCGKSANATGSDRVKQERFLANATRVMHALPA